ncbi:hypothetical protein [Rhizorhabdus argentea]|uniref:hypothetical protein n=1 Tax=Rhizorhabdus argentea TaxID=1387174 RepID=UPI0030EC5056
MKRVLVPLAAVMLCIGIAIVTSYSKQQPASNAVESAATAATPLPRRATAFGINLSPLVYWTNERSFMNLVVASGTWRSTTTWSAVDPKLVDRNGTLLALPPGEQATLALTRPAAAHRGDVTIRCRFDGTGVVDGINVVDMKTGPGQIVFLWKKEIAGTGFRVKATDPADPIRNVDCREADADPKLLFDPAFVDSLRPYKAVRFLDWQMANANAAVSWPARTLPTATIQGSPQGVAVEHLVALANLARVDPWFVMPWNADAAYMEGFAQYVHDHLDPARTAYVEIGNEIWNMGFPAGRQALAEGLQAKLGQTSDEARMRRYAEHSVEGFKIWERVYAREPRRIVRVLSGQNSWPQLFQYALDYQDTTRHVDALSTALYFGQRLLNDPLVDTSDIAPLFPKLEGSIESTFASARQFKQMADARGLRYIGYEGGQHASYAGKDRALIARLNRDPRMGDAYRLYLAGWDRGFGDLLMLFHSVSPAGSSMHFGLAEYSGQPMAETPKRKAVLDAIAATKR